MRRWFGGDADCDAAIKARFSGAVEAAGRGDLDDWASDPRGRLALILLLDQFPRSLYRGSARAFAHDAAALSLTIHGIERSHDRALGPLERLFFYMPMQHAESLDVQERSVAIFTALAENATQGPIAAALAGCATYARQHRDIIARFGRFPHRNAALGRVSSPQETAYLAGGAPKFGQ